MITNYAVWVPAMFINFKFVPPTLQVLFSNFIGFGWNIYLSKISYQTEPVSLTAITNDSIRPEE
jgi:protein Mpv17